MKKTVKEEVIKNLNKLENDNNKKIETYALITNCGISARGREDELLTILATYIHMLEDYTSKKNIRKAIYYGLNYEEIIKGE